MYTAVSERVPYSHLHYNAKWEDASSDHQAPSTKVISSFQHLAFVNASFLLPFLRPDTERLLKQPSHLQLLNETRPSPDSVANCPGRFYHPATAASWTQSTLLQAAARTTAPASREGPRAPRPGST